MTDSSKYLPMYTLNQLADRVAMKVDYISRLYKADKVWDNIIELCQKIEAEPRNVSTVIVEVSKDTGMAVNGSSIRWCHVRLTLVNILLYYRHIDSVAYNKTVFPQLVSKMGAYADDKILKNKIQKEIEKIKEEDKILEQEILKSQSNKAVVIPSVPNKNDMEKGRRQFIQAINAGHIVINSIDWADATLAFNREVMKEFFWGIEDDSILKSVIKAIKNRWEDLRKVSDNRCLEITHSTGMPFNIDPWKFGGLTKESIDKFFDDLWVERRARIVYCSAYTDVIQNDGNKGALPSSSHQQNSNSDDLEIIESLKTRVEELESNKKQWNAEKKDLNEKIHNLENKSGWIACFDNFLHSSLDAKAIADALNNISSPHLPKNERSYWWVFYVSLLEINWILDSANHKTVLQWVNLHFNMGWDWRSEQLFKFTIEKKYKVKHSSEWSKMGTTGKYYAELSERMRDAFVRNIDGVLFDREKYVLPGSESPNGRVTKK